MEHKQSVSKNSLSAHDGQQVKLDVTPTTQKLEHLLCGLAVRLKREFADQISHDPAIFKKQVIRFIRRELPPKPGRPNDPRIDAAARLVEQGKSVKAVLRIQIRGFDKLDPYERYLAEKGLRAAISRRRKRQTTSARGLLH